MGSPSAPTPHGNPPTKARGRSTFQPASPAAPSPSDKRKASDTDRLHVTPTKKTKTLDAGGERRLRRFRAQPSQNFHQVYNRALSQRFYILERRRRRCGGTPEAPEEEEEVDLAGSTGNIYTVTISHRPSCTCPHFLKGHQCKHWLYVMSRVLRAKFEYTYQLALLTSELREIFLKAPPPPPPVDSSSSSSKDKNRRKPVQGDCPICFCELETESNAEAVVWCRAACGQNIHRECFEAWAATKRKGGYGAALNVTCPYCRSVWQADDEDVLKKVKKSGRPTAEGYVNVADQLGISPHRDYSTYSTWFRGPTTN